MSGFTRDTRHDGDRLVYEAVQSKWRRYHARHCGCEQNWPDRPRRASFTVVRDGGGFVALTGPGLTEGVNESALTTDALWLAVTGKPGEGWIEPVHTVDRSAAAEAQRKADHDAHYQVVRRRAAAAKIEPASAAQMRYLDNLATRVGRAQLQIEYGRAVKGAGIAPLEAHEEPGPALRRLTKAAARRLITALVSATTEIGGANLMSDLRDINRDAK